MNEFTHIDDQGRARMVDVSDKEKTRRLAVARGMIRMRPDTLEKIYGGDVKKGNVLETARIAGVMAAKRTSELIPMCHPLALTHLDIEFSADRGNHAVAIRSEVSTLDRTGVEMEAIVAVSVAAVTIYDMCKSYDRKMVVSEVGLIKKSGGKSGTFEASPEP